MQEKKIKGRKRHIAVDILGSLLYIKVHSAALPDTKIGCDVFASTLKKYPTIEAFSADQGYRKTAKNYVENTLKVPLHISKKLAIIHLLYYLNVGSLKELLLGSETSDAWLKISKYYVLLLKISFGLL